MATLDDVVTVQKNGVIAINNLATTLKAYNEGEYTSTTYTSGQNVVVTGSGRLISFAVVVAGTGDGKVYNASTTASATPSAALCSTPATTGIYPAGLRFNSGLIVEPGPGQSINVTYSKD